MLSGINDALRHLEKDMADLLSVMQDKNTTEVILNPYRMPDGNYEGHVLVETHGGGLQNLIRNIELDVIIPSITLGQQVVIKKSHIGEIIYWFKYAGAADLLTGLTNLILNYFDNNLIRQSRDTNLILYANNILTTCPTISNHTINSGQEVNDILHLVNLNLPNNALFKLELYKLDSVDKINNLPKFPSRFIKNELVKMSATKAETIMSVLASITGKFIHNKSPHLECQIPKYGHRFTGVIPPATLFPAFCIRKHAPKIYTLDDFVTQGILQVSSRDTIISWIKRKFNILIAGGTGSGKTTLANAILYEIAKLFPEARILIIEDVAELQFNTSRSVALSVGEFFSMYDALRTTLRFKPERIVMGEVRGAEAYTLLKAWNTGHPGGIATIHANGVNEALYRFESCVRDHPNVKINRQEFGFTINGIISIQNIMVKEESHGEIINVSKRRVTALRQIIQYDPEKDIYQDVVFDKLDEVFD